MNSYNHPLNNPHVFFFEIKNSKTFDVAYSLPYSLDDKPTEQDVDDLAKHLADAIKAKREALGWEHPDLFYRICHHSPMESDMGLDMAFDIYHKVSKILDGKE
jgi:hypothetical protein